MNIDHYISTCKGHILKLDKNRDSNHGKFIRYLDNSVFYLFIFNIGALKNEQYIRALKMNDMTLVGKCSGHPKYQGKREPKIGCIKCWQYFVDQEKWRMGQRLREAEYTRLRQKE